MQQMQMHIDQKRGRRCTSLPLPETWLPLPLLPVAAWII
jgi:hypothetical protein